MESAAGKWNNSRIQLKKIYEAVQNFLIKQLTECYDKFILYPVKIICENYDCEGRKPW